MARRPPFFVSLALDVLTSHHLAQKTSLRSDNRKHHHKGQQGMFFRFSFADGLRLEDCNNFCAFKLVVDGCREELERVRRALGGAIELVDVDTAWVFEATLRGAPEVVQDQAWQDALGTMIEKTRPHSWIDDVRMAIQAHVEWRGDAS